MPTKLAALAALRQGLLAAKAYAAEQISALAEAVSGLLEDLEASKAEKSQSLSAALPASGWSGSGPYTQVVQVAGVTADTNALLDFAHAEDDATEKTRAAAWACITFFEEGAGTITATCLGSKPTTDLTLRIILLG